jgi:hypothetical protein
MSIDWREELVHYLISAGLTGRPQQEITKKFKAVVDAASLENELEAMQNAGKVQKFKVEREGTRQGRPSTIWRATTKILE